MKNGEQKKKLQEKVVKVRASKRREGKHHLQCVYVKIKLNEILRANVISNSTEK